MCRILSASFRKPFKTDFVKEQIYYQAYTLSSYHNSGWGIMFNSPEFNKYYVKKYSCPCYSNFLSKDTINLINSNNYIFHIRKASININNPNILDTHPFVKECKSTKTKWVLCHNGTLKKKFQKIETYPVCGNTDSEYILSFILDCVDRTMAFNFNFKDYLYILHRNIAIFNKEYGSMCLSFFDGTNMYFYSDIKGDRVLYRKKIRTKKNEGFIFATEPKETWKWQIMYPGTLMVLRNGKLIFSETERCY